MRRRICNNNITFHGARALVQIHNYYMTKYYHLKIFIVKRFYTM